MNEGARQANEANAQRHASGQRDETNRRLARIEALLEALLRHQGFAVDERSIVSPVRITVTQDDQDPFLG